nr:MAG TPA: hypothetical protein [Caudoviricetes sp.]
MKTYVINVIDSNGISGKTYANVDELATVIKWLLLHDYNIESVKH